MTGYWLVPFVLRRAVGHPGEHPRVDPADLAVSHRSRVGRSVGVVDVEVAPGDADLAIVLYEGTGAQIESLAASMLTLEGPS